MKRIKWLDLVRVFGLCLVLGYHLFYQFLPGGFLGVTIFFTLSGFLITAVILNEVRQHGGFGLFKFYQRRIRRILIPLVVVMVFTLPLTLLIAPDFTVNIARQLAAALSFTSNWFYILTGSSYEAQVLPSMYVHIWALAVEVQFYLVWGLICFLVTKLAKFLSRRGRGDNHFYTQKIILIVAGLAAIISFAYLLFLYNSGVDVNAIYFNSLTCFSFFIGAAAATLWGLPNEKDEVLRKKMSPLQLRIITAVLIAAAILIMAIIVGWFSQHKFGDEFMYRSGFLWTSILTVILIYLMHGLHVATPPASEEPKILKALASMSYEIYLVHWPIYVIISALILNNWLAASLTLLVTFLFAALMDLVTERILNPQLRREFLQRHKIIVALAIFLTLAALTADVIVIKKAPPITKIEEDFAANYVSADAAEILSLARGLVAINESPVATVTANLNLSAALLPPKAATADFGAILEAAGIPREMSAEIISGVTVIGDSVPLGAQNTMANLIPNCHVDAAVSRSISAGANIISSLQNQGNLREYVVVALGTNGTYNHAQILTQIIETVNTGHKLIFVTPFDGRPNENSRITNEIATWMRDLPNQYHFVTVADWNALIGSQVELLAGDKVHLGGQAAMNLYANNVAQAIGAAASKPGK